MRIFYGGSGQFSRLRLALETFEIGTGDRIVDNRRYRAPVCLNVYQRDILYLSNGQHRPHGIHILRGRKLFDHEILKAR